MEEERVKGGAAAAEPLEAEARAEARPGKRRFGAVGPPASWVREGGDGEKEADLLSSPLTSRQGREGGKHKGRASAPHSQSNHTINTEQEKRRVSRASGALATVTTFCSPCTTLASPPLEWVLHRGEARAFVLEAVKLAMALLQGVEDGGDGGEEDDDEEEGMVRGRS
jgi:hypothetical protein